ncbi:GNAT domain-containing protein [Serratia phage Moabite]|uniref:N-acetyltransferase domain-containing protein n=3 Tax=Moabitevirus TaxID=2843422 RepID=A0A7T3TLY1_9CAUD|nr:hypothetical protein HWB23_gp008 [Serratia phage vB_SmaM_ 2050HW]YP_009849195.1 GNAT domain-containing protein [Serratia phage Moabite]QPX76722.1 hypothetical protein [Serratia phage vB_SmaM_Yaphecito]UCR74633.1 hypothetical protein [Serratia phage BUCT660]UQT03495.1 acyl-CoA N-acetyltransferase [Serratia phage vB_SmaM-Kodama]URG14200.1 hypothetical protein [Pectobacterium phage vB_ParM-25]ATA65343.1 hypothetical protein 2050HW_00008 [Serratia phage vB_SmaM_ 2050HW]
MRTLLRTQRRVGSTLLVFREVSGKILGSRRELQYARLAKEAYKEYQVAIEESVGYRPFSLGGNREHILHYWGDDVTRRNYFVYDNELPIGFINARKETTDEGIKKIIIDRVFVLPEHRNKGAGRYLVDGFIHAEDWSMVEISGYLSSVSLMGFLTKLGFYAAKSTFVKANA